MLASSPACAFVVRSSKEQCCGSSAGPVNVQHIGGSWKMAASEVEFVGHAIQLPVDGGVKQTRRKGKFSSPSVSGRSWNCLLRTTGAPLNSRASFAIGAARSSPRLAILAILRGSELLCCRHGRSFVEPALIQALTYGHGLCELRSLCLRWAAAVVTT